MPLKSITYTFPLSLVMNFSSNNRYSYIFLTIIELNSTGLFCTKNPSKSDSEFTFRVDLFD